MEPLNNDLGMPSTGRFHAAIGPWVRWYLGANTLRADVSEQLFPVLDPVQAYWWSEFDHPVRRTYGTGE